MKLLATSPTREGITKKISEYFYGSTITLTEGDMPSQLKVSTLRAPCPEYEVRIIGNRYRFEQIVD